MSITNQELIITRAAAAKKPPSPFRGPPITHFEPDDLGYLRGLKTTYEIAGLMPRGTRANGPVSAKALQRARMVKARLEELFNPKKAKRQKRP
jgi:hypothetical protein